MAGAVRSLVIYGLFLLFLVSNTAFAQTDLTTRGKEFWFGFMQNRVGDSPTLSVLVSSPNETVGTVRVGAFSRNFTVPANSTIQIIIPTTTALITGSESVRNDLAVQVTTSDSVNVYALNQLNRSTDATIVLPTPVLGREYYAMGYLMPREGSLSQFLIVATEDNTEIEITPTAQTLGDKPANQPFTVTLQRGQVYQVQSRSDLTGSRVRAVGNGCKPFAFFSGANWTGVGNCGGLQNHLFEQMFPVVTWGQTYITTPFLTRNGDVFRIIASQNNTVVRIGNQSPITLNRGQLHEVTLTNATLISGDKPIAVTQFSRSSECDNVRNSDPFMINLSSIDQMVIKNVTISGFNITQIPQPYVNIITRTRNTGLVRLNDQPITTWQTVPNATDYSFSRQTIAQANHTITSDSGFVAYVYGYGEIDGYGYAADAVLNDISLKIVNPIFTEHCLGQPIEFSANSSLPVTSWKWDFDDGDTLSGTGTIERASKIYDQPGNYEVKLITLREGNCLHDTVRRRIFIGRFNLTNIRLTDLRCADGRDGRISFDIIDGTPPYSYEWSGNVSNTNPATNLPAGIHTVTVTDSDGCVGIHSFTLTQPNAITATATGTNNCNPNSGAIAITNPSGGTPPYSYRIRPSDNFGTSANFSGLSDGTYTPEVRDANGCISSLTPVVLRTQTGTAAAPPAAVTATICGTGRATLFANSTSPGVTYRWYDSPTATTPIFTGNPFITPTLSASQTYYVSAFSSTLCESNRATATIRVKNASSINKAANNWFFGARAGLDFSTGNPVVRSDGRITTDEGSAVMSDLNGNLIFYTDGDTIFTRNHTRMPNGIGLLGNESSTQSALIIPNPGDTAKYYVFTTNSIENLNRNNGIPLAYSEVDMRLNGGLGDIVVGTKNTILNRDVSERLTAVQHANGRDFWLLTISANSTEVLAYNIDAVRVNPNPVRSAAGGTFSGSFQRRGQLKASPDGNKLAYVTTGAPNGNLRIYDFNKTTGQASNLIEISGFPVNQTYGVEFSPNGRYVYVSTRPDPTLNPVTSYIFQFDLQAGDAQAIRNSRVTIAQTNSDARYGALQVAPDGKIYVARYNITCMLFFCNMTNTDHLGAIPNPNVGGTGAGFTNRAVVLPRGTSTNRGLPAFNPAIFMQDLPILGEPNFVICNNNPVRLNFRTGFRSYQWYRNGQPLPNSNAATITVTQPGEYYVQAINSDTCTISAQSINVTEATGGRASATVRQPTCGTNGQSSQVTASMTGGTAPFRYRWGDQSGAVVDTNRTVTGLPAGTYTVTVTDANFCATTTSVTINSPGNLRQPPNFTMTTCNPNTVLVYPTAQIAALYTNVSNTRWYNSASATTPIFEGRNFPLPGFTSQTFYVSLIVDGCETPRATYQVTAIPAPPDLNVTTNTGSLFFCPNSSLTLQATSGWDYYRWFYRGVLIAEGTNRTTVTVTQPGTYTAIANQLFSWGDTCRTFTFNITLQTIRPMGFHPSVRQPTCGNNTGTIIVDSVTTFVPPLRLSWLRDGQPFDVTQYGDSMVLLNIPPGVYAPQVRDNSGCSYTFPSITIRVSSDIRAITTILKQNDCRRADNGEFSVSVEGGIPPFTYQIEGFPPQNVPVFSKLVGGNYLVTVTDANGCTTSQPVTIQPQRGIEFRVVANVAPSCFGDTTGRIQIVRNCGGSEPFSFFWSNGRTTPNINNLGAGTYVVTITDPQGCRGTLSVTVEQPQPLALNLVAGRLVLNPTQQTGSITVAASGGTTPYRYQINGIQTNTTGVFSNIPAGNYTVTVIDERGCRVSMPIQIIQKTCNLGLDVSVVSDNCPNQSGAISTLVRNAANPVVYAWSNGATSHRISNLRSGRYTLTLTDALGCVVDTTIFVPAGGFRLEVAGLDNEGCTGNQDGRILTRVVGGVPPYLFTWNNGQMTQDAIRLSAGTYTLDATDANRCLATLTATIDRQPPLAIRLTRQINAGCGAPNDGELAVEATGGTPPYLYTWSNGLFTNSITNLPAGKYDVTVADARRCLVTASYTVNQYSNLGIKLTTIDANQTSGGTITVLAENATALPLSYALNGGLWQSSNIFSNLPVGTYQVTLRDALGCLRQATAVIERRSIACPAPAPLSFSNLSPEGFTIHWNAIQEAIRGYEVRYRAQKTPDWITIIQTSNSLTLSGLQANTTYEVEVRSLCANGVVSSNATTATVTTSLLTCIPPSGLVVTMTGTITARISWNAVPAATGYVVEYRKVGASLWRSRSVATTSLNLTGLDAETNYETRVRTLCPDGRQSVFTPTVQFQ